MFPNFRQSLSSIGTGNMSESYVEAKTVLSMRKKLSSNFTVFWNNRRLIGSCLYSLVLARGLFLKRFPPLLITSFTAFERSGRVICLWYLFWDFCFNFSFYIFCFNFFLVVLTPADLWYHSRFPRSIEHAIFVTSRTSRNWVFCYAVLGHSHSHPIPVVGLSL